MAANTSITIKSVDYRGATIADSAVVSPLAVVGAAGEWRDKPTKYVAVVLDGAIIREFVRVHAGCNRPTIIGSNVLLMAGSHVGHDSRVGEHTEIAPNAVIGGCAEIGRRVKIGMNATVLPFVRIGDNARIGAGAVVTRDVPANETWVGNPAKKISSGPNKHLNLNDLKELQDTVRRGGR